MLTRCKVGLVKLCHVFYLLAFTQTGQYQALFIKTNVKDFITTFKHEHWKDDMNDEILALHQNHMWTLVPRPKSSNVVRSK